MASGGPPVQAPCLTLFIPQVLTWAKQHEQRLEMALTEVLNNANLLEELLSWLQWAETTLVQRDTEPLPQDIPLLKTLITEHQVGYPGPAPEDLEFCFTHSRCLFSAGVHGGDDQEAAGRGQSDENLQEKTGRSSQQPG